MGVFEEAFLVQRWLDEPDAWEETYVVEAYGQRFVFHLVALRNHSKAWCGYLGYRGDLPITDDGYRAVEACAHKGEVNGTFWPRRDPNNPGHHTTEANHTPLIPWPGYVYPGFDCSRLGDWTPDRAGNSVRPTEYRTLEYVQRCVRAMADTFVEQLDPTLAAMVELARHRAELEEDADCLVGPEPVL